MHMSSDLSHWVCLLAGLTLVLTGFLLRDIVREQSSVMPPPGVPRPTHWQRRGGYGRRAILIAVGLGAAAYGISRIVL